VSEHREIREAVARPAHPDQKEAPVAVTKDMLLSELQDLLRLTAFEQTIATIRRSQAASTPIAEELAANAEKSGERRQLLAQAVRQVGGVPDVVGAALGKAGALVQTQLNQVQTLQGALLGDLALEHQLRERARYARTLAESLGYSQVIPVLDRLETAHTATIEWLETRLAEVGRTGTSALRATPVQAAVTVARRTIGAPFGVVAAGVNRASSLLGRTPGSASATTSGVGSAVDSAVSTVEAAAEDLTGATRAGVEKTKETGGQAPQQVLDLTGFDGQSEPFPAYGKLSGDSVMRHVADSDDVDHLREILAFEQAHKARKGVVQALEQRLQELSATV
jgi:bacterioferritin (cytochrome b1)